MENKEETRKRQIYTFEKLKEFCKKNNRLPSSRSSDNEERGLYSFLWNNRDNPEFKKLREKYKATTNLCYRRYTFEELEEFCKKNNRLPSGKKKGEWGLCNLLRKHRDEPEFGELYEKYSRKIHNNYTFEELEEFCKKNNRLPGSKESSLYGFLLKHRDEPEFRELYEKYSRSNRAFEELEEFCKKNNRLPICRGCKEERGLYSLLLKHKSEPRFKELYEKYGKRSEIVNHSYEELKEFCEKNNRLPKYKGERGLYSFLWKHKHESGFKELYEKYGSLYRNYHTFEELEEFCRKNNRLPSSYRKEEISLYNFLWKHKNNKPGFKELYDMYNDSKPNKMAEKDVEVKDVIIPEPEPTECSKESYVERITKLTKEFLEAWGSEATIDTLETLLKDVNKEKRNALITLYGKLGVS